MNFRVAILAIIIIIIGLLMLSSATSVISFDRTQDSYAFVKQQILHGILPGILLFLCAVRINYRTYEKLAPFFLAATVILIALVFIPGLGAVRNNVRGWIQVSGLSVQTSEIAKLTFILWLSAFLSHHRQHIKSFKRTTLPFLLAVGVICGLLVLQPDIGTMMIFGALALSIFIIANGHALHVLLAAGIGLLAAVPIIIRAPYRLQRLLTFWNPETDIQDSGYHVYQILISLGSGHWWGLGIGQSRQKFNYVPEIASDSVFAIIGEELGFIFASIFLLLFLFLFREGVAIAKRSQTNFGFLLAFGIILNIVGQMLINIGSMLGLIPLTGIPLPFVSLGGTNLAVLMASLGILTNISKVQRIR